MKYKIINSKDYCNIAIIENLRKSSVDFPIEIYELEQELRVNWKRSLEIPRDIDELFIIVSADLRDYKKQIIKELYSEFRKFVDRRIIITLVCKIDGKFVVLYSK